MSYSTNLFPVQQLSSFSLTHFQSQKTAELLLDLKVNSIICSPQVAAVDTATAICEVNISFTNRKIWLVAFYLICTNFQLRNLISWSHLQVQEAADCLGADCVPRYVEMKNLLGLEIDDAFLTKQKVRRFTVSVVYDERHHTSSTLKTICPERLKRYGMK